MAVSLSRGIKRVFFFFFCRSDFLWVIMLSDCELHLYSVNQEKLKKKQTPKDICGTVEFKAFLSFSKQKDDDIEEGDLPEHKRPPAPIDFSKIDPGKPESILKLTKKGKTLMMFVTVSGNPTEKETEEITSLWQGSLFNANYDVQRFIVGSNRAIFMLRDGGYVYPGKGADGNEKVKNKTKPEKTKKKKDTEKKSNGVKEDNRATTQREDL
uniref:LRP chaperone MESD n=1 Tax=Malurus cyaneus samueli TaxID=2593467 RepID=A0A8C5TTV3_9PASS